MKTPNAPNGKTVQPVTALALAALIAVSLATGLAACGGGSADEALGLTSGGSTTETICPPLTAPSSLKSPYAQVSGANTVPISVSIAPGGGGYPDEPLVSVKICIPGSQVNCQIIPDVLLDTGSVGLRLIHSVVTLNLPAVTVNGSPLGECELFAGAFDWGPVVTADVSMADEVGSSVPIQLMSGSDLGGPPGISGRNCGTLNPESDTVATFGANGVLGVGNDVNDCESTCTQSITGNQYFGCPNSTNCAGVLVTLAEEVQNPVSMFAAPDNNGVLISLPSVQAGGIVTATGSMAFGIGTQANNGLTANSLGTAAQIYTTDNFGDVTSGNQCGASSVAFMDTGTPGLSPDPNLLYSPATSTLPAVCANGVASGFYCPSPTFNAIANVENLAETGATDTQISFSLANPTAGLTSGFAAFSDLGFPGSAGEWDWGLPFFLGRNTFVAIEGRVAAGTTGPYLAF